MAHVRFRRRKWVHTRLCSKDRTQWLTRRNRGPSLPRPQCGFVLPAKLLCYTTRFRRALIYIHFPVLCGSQLSAEGENSAKLPHKFYPQPLFIPIFNFSHKRPTFAFTPESGYILAFAQRNRTQGHTRRNRGILDGGAITTLGLFHTFRKPCVAGY